MFARAASRDEARQAAEAGADVIIAEGEIDDAVAGAHQAGARAAVTGDVAAVERASADCRRRGTRRACGALVRRAPPAPRHRRRRPRSPTASVGRAQRVSAVRARKKHAAFQRGAARSLAGAEGRRAWELHATSDSVIVAINDSDGEWTIDTGFRAPIDLLGGHAEDERVRCARMTSASIVRSPMADATKY